MVREKDIRFSRELAIDQLKADLISQLPPDAQVSTVLFEGPFVVIYSLNPTVLMENGDIVKSLARSLRKRIVIRSDVTVRRSKEEARARIMEIVPENAEITGIIFDDELGDVIIEAKKPGAVIGRSGATLREITRDISWRPKVVRSPPIQSELINSIRRTLTSESETRRNALLNIGKRIHRPKVIEDEFIRLTGLGGFSEVGRSCMLLETAETKILVDCGTNVGSREPDQMFPFFNASEFDLTEIDAVLVTHAHLDHCGLIPFLYKWGYRGPVYSNDATLSLMTLLQKDYIEVAARENRLVPYSQRDIKKMILHTITRRYGEVTDLSNDIRLTMTPAGHILGSSIMHLHIGDGRYNLAIANDFKGKRSRLLDRANTKFPRLECIIMESTYGGPRDIMPRRNDAEIQLIKIINQTVRRGGKVLIPSLAVGRPQELMVVLANYFRKHKLVEVPVYLDGLIAEATAIHSCHPEYLSSYLQDQIFNEGQNPFLSEIFHNVDNQSERQAIIYGKPAVIMATSGMLTGGNSVEYFRDMAEDSRNSIVFVSYQAEGTLGRRIASGVKEIRSIEDGRMKMLQVKMDIHQIDGFSGHSDRGEIMNFFRELSPKPERVVLIHGKRKKSQSLGQALSKRYHIKVEVPQNLETIRFN
ncbi:MAG: beta-CASP ribonuclease aCPSF1 [Candidatus Heimdallarchaeota archaeon]|nr:MAG: beta-CASP ribonuclease aCPSF1 [Candidatus Heimdallarchaeota archaeon]